MAVESLLFSGCKRSSSRCGPGREPVAQAWAERSEAEINERIATALQCARDEHKKVLLEFTAPWCADCRAMTLVEQREPVASVLSQQYERVRINVRRWDSHRALVQRYSIHAIAAYVVLDPVTQRVVAQTTREPATGAQRGMTDEQWAAWLRTPTPSPATQ